ncbi:MAG: RNA polymerase sigma factor [Gemmatimonadales bacterium]
MSEDTPGFDLLKDMSTLAFRRVGDSVPLADVLHGARQGFPQFLGELYRRYRKQVLAFLERLAPTDAEDLCQEVFLKLPATLASYEERGNFEGWLKRIAFNTYRTRRRSADRRREDALGADTAEEQLPGMGAVTREDLWSHALAGMPEALREAWVLHREGYQAGEIGEMTGISAGAAATRLSRAREYLARRLPDLT